jgi:hypothetical protein
MQLVARFGGAGKAARGRAVARMRAQAPATAGLAAQRGYESGPQGRGSSRAYVIMLAAAV